MPQLITATDTARAIEAVNRHRQLSPSARRVALELISALDRKTATAWRSVGGIARRLGCCERTVSNGLRQLRELGLVNSRRNGSKGLLFRLVWTRLRAIHAALRRVIGKFSKGKVTPQSFVLAARKQGDRQAVADVFTPNKIIRILGRKTHQVLPDHVLDQRASSRLWSAIRSMPGNFVGTVVANLTPDLEAEAIRAERYKPADGRTGLSVLARAFHAMVTP